MKVSIITPSFNRAKYIEETIKSVLNQSYKNIEYIVVDGGSKDGTIEILEEYSHKGKLKYISEPDKGMYDAINKGIRMSNGNVIAYLNTDDQYFPWTIETVLKTFHANKNIDIIYGDSVVVESDGRLPKLNFFPRYTHLWLRSGGIIAQPTVFFKREGYEKIGDFSINVHLIADCEYWLRAAIKNMNFHKINEFLAIEYNHETTLRNKFKAQIKQEKNFLVQKYRHPAAKSSIAKLLVLRSKYIEKELLTLWFITKLKFNLHGRFWKNYLSSHIIQSHFRFYILNKIFRTTKPIWTVYPKL